MQETKVLLETITSELKERDRKITDQKEKMNVLVAEIKKLQSQKLSKDTVLSKEYQNGWNQLSAIIKQRLEEILYDATEEIGVRLNDWNQNKPQ